MTDYWGISESALGGKSWPNPLDKILIAQAVELEAPEMIAENGEVFVIEYLKDRVLIKPASRHKFVPTGYFSYQEIRNWGI